MSTEQLPDGLQLAVNLLEGDRDAFVVCHRHPIHGLEQEDAEIAGEYLGAINAIRDEHAKRLTLQRHAADMAQQIEDLRFAAEAGGRRIAELEAGRDALRAKHEELLLALHGIGRALGIHEGDRSPYSVMCGVLERVNRLAEIEAQEPACWAVIDPTGGGSIEYTAAWREACHEHIGDLIAEYDRPDAASLIVRPLFTGPVPAQAVPTGERQAVLLTDDDVWKSDAIMSANEAAGLPMFQLMLLVHAIQAAALAANGLEVRRG